MIKLPVDRDDDEHFVSAVEAVISGVVETHRIHDVIAVKVDNWFGSKWLGFSHKTLGALGVHRREDLPVPPFVPSRVVSESRFVRDSDTASFDAAALDQSVHVPQSSPENKSRRLSLVFPNTALFWWCGRSAPNARGALMCYLPTQGGHTGWYAGYRREGGWSESDSVLVTEAELSRFVGRARSGTLPIRGSVDTGSA